MSGRSDASGPGQLTVGDLGALKRAGRWGLLRYQSNLRFTLSGEFSMPATDVARLIEAAGGRVMGPGADVGDVLVTGVCASEFWVGRAEQVGALVLDEAGLVAQLTPTLESLEAHEGQPPF